jgi:hypothetical protein
LILGFDSWGYDLPNEGVVARLERAIQYSGTVRQEPRGRGVLDAPVKPGMTVEGVAAKDMAARQ